MDDNIVGMLFLNIFNNHSWKAFVEQNKTKHTDAGKKA